jgi:hypothetical protein
MVNWDAADLEAAFSPEGTYGQSAGLSDVHLQVETVTTQQHVSAEHLARWFGASPEGQRPSYGQRLRQSLSAAELAQVQALFERQLRGQSVAWTSQVAYLLAHR